MIHTQLKQVKTLAQQVLLHTGLPQPTPGESISLNSRHLKSISTELSTRWVLVRCLTVTQTANTFLLEFLLSLAYLFLV